jgi:hypothetical protein
MRQCFCAILAAVSEIQNCITDDRNFTGTGNATAKGT